MHRPWSLADIFVPMIVGGQYVQDRLARAVTRVDGTHLAGPEARWISRRHGRRQGPALGDVVES